MPAELDSSKPDPPSGYSLDDIHSVETPPLPVVPLPPSPWVPNAFQPIRQLLLETTWDLLLIERKKSGR
jgi:hypothetical protein